MVKERAKKQKERGVCERMDREKRERERECVGDEKGGRKGG